MNTSLYFHIPFCRRRCGYCDFVTFAGFDRLIPQYVDALNKQVELMGDGSPVHTIFFGGGTPSLVPVSCYQELSKTIHNHFDVLPDAEISLEANPGTVDLHTLSGYREVGFNRISFGMQSAREDELLILDRAHSMEEVKQAVRNSRSAGFTNINLDLIFGLPGQTLDNWKYSLETALELEPDHLSLYSLIVEEGTPLANQIENGLLPMPDDDVAAEQYEWSCDLLAHAGYGHYEISNWAKISPNIDFRCQHNLQYWRLLPYYGFGCGAVGFLPEDSNSLTGNKSSIMQNEKWIGKYIQKVDQAFQQKTPEIFLEPVEPEYEMATRLFVGFRLLEEGVDPIEFKLRFGKDIHQIFGEKIQKLLSDDLIEYSPEGKLRLSRKAWLVANRVFREFAGGE
jgi:oxygen-independent coproporphyrinogen III oxidase